MVRAMLKSILAALGGFTVQGEVFRFFAADHRRLDSLLAEATAAPDAVGLEPFGLFRAGLLRHIGMEEKLLFPALRAALPASASIAAKLRVDHGALVALLVPTPTPAVVTRILSVLTPHNRREEGPEGVYALCDRSLAPAEAERLVEKARAFPDPPLNPYNDGPLVQSHVETTLELARRQWE
jgi:hypothetical protein